MKVKICISEGFVLGLISIMSFELHVVKVRVGRK